jgi:hypothetical protein
MTQQPQQPQQPSTGQPPLSAIANFLQQTAASLPPDLHSALAGVRGQGAYYGGAPVAPGPSGYGGVPAVPGTSGAAPMRLPMTSIKGTGARIGGVDVGSPEAVPAADNSDFLRNFERTHVLDKLLGAKDFRPSITEGRMKFRSLTPEENKIINRIGYSRHPDVTFDQETNPFSAPAAWEKNLQYWRNLSGPPKGN